MSEPIVINIDGASSGNPGPASIGIVIADRAGTVLEEIGEAIGHATNNEAEYRALIRALERAAERGATAVKILSDSQLVVRQVEGAYAVNMPHLRQLRDRVCAMAAAFRFFRLEWVPRERNEAANALADAALGRVADPDAFNFHNFQRLKAECDRLERENTRLRAHVWGRERLRDRNASAAASGQQEGEIGDAADTPFGREVRERAGIGAGS